MTSRLNSRQMMTSQNERNIIFNFFSVFVMYCFASFFTVLFKHNNQKNEYFWLFHLWIASRNKLVSLKTLDAFRFVNYCIVRYLWQAYNHLSPQQFGCVYNATRLAVATEQRFFFCQLSPIDGVRIWLKVARSCKVRMVAITSWTPLHGSWSWRMDT